MIGPQGGPSARPVVQPPVLPSNRRDVAPGLPGARSNQDMVAPADRPAMQMRPTEALFDAINRGDISGSRDAVGRGAELNKPNILGLTPLELAVDLGRKDIVFFLLSLRGMEDRPSTRPGGAAAGARPTMTGGPSAAAASASRAAATPPAARAEARRPAPQLEREPAPVAPKGAQLSLGDGGSPSPDAGFLGFGGERAVRR